MDPLFLEKGRHQNATKLVKEKAIIALQSQITIAYCILKLLTSLHLESTTALQPGYAIYQNLEGLLLKAANKEDYSSEFTEVTRFYGSDIDNSELTSQLLIFATKFATECPASKKITLVDILSYLRSLSEGQRTFFSQVCTIAHLLLILPSTNAVSERSFSCMRQLKSYLRSTMGQARLNHLMLLSIYKDLLDGLDLKVIANEFVQESEHPQRVFGDFTT